MSDFDPTNKSHLGALKRAVHAVHQKRHAPKHTIALRKAKDFLDKNRGHKMGKSAALKGAFNKVPGLADGVITRDNLIEAIIEAVDPKQLRMGIEVEREHGDRDKSTDVFKKKDGKSTKGFRKIALAHLKEVPDYYTRLAKMERRGKKAHKTK